MKSLKSESEVLDVRTGNSVAMTTDHQQSFKVLTQTVLHKMNSIFKYHNTIKPD